MPEMSGGTNVDMSLTVLMGFTAPQWNEEGGSPCGTCWRRLRCSASAWLCRHTSRLTTLQGINNLWLSNSWTHSTPSSASTPGSGPIIRKASSWKARSRQVRRRQPWPKPLTSKSANPRFPLPSGFPPARVCRQSPIPPTCRAACRWSLRSRMGPRRIWWSCPITAFPWPPEKSSETFCSQLPPADQTLQNLPSWKSS